MPYYFNPQTYIKDKIEESEQIVVDQKKKRKKIFSWSFFALSILIVIFILIYQLRNERVVSFADLIAFQFNGWYFLVAILCLFGVIAVDTFRYMLVIRHSTNKWRPSLGYKTSAIGRYYDCITPFSTGGQPFQVYFLKRRGLKSSQASSVPVEKFIVGQMSVLFFFVIALGLSFALNIWEANSVIIGICILSFVVNLAGAFLILLISTNQKVGKVLIEKSLMLLRKLRIIKDYQKHYQKLKNFIADYQITVRKFTRSKWLFLRMVLLSVLYLLFYYSIPFFIYSAFNGFDFNMWLIIYLKALLIDMAVSVIPLPGGTGLSEVSFAALFTSIFTSGTLFWALILWRFFSYYFYLIQGMIVLLQDYFFGQKKYQWVKRKWELETESNDFIHKVLEGKIKPKKNK